LPFDFSLLLRLLDKGKEVDFISALDHPDDYCLDFHRFPKWIQVFEGTHWRSAASTCLTFLTKKKTLTRFSQIFRSYERDNYDTSLWMSVTKHRLFNVFSPMVYNPDDKFFNLRALVKAWRYGFGQNLLGARARLWVPMPSLALHLDSSSFTRVEMFSISMSREFRSGASKSGCSQSSKLLRAQAEECKSIGRPLYGPQTSSSFLAWNRNWAANEAGGSIKGTSAETIRGSNRLIRSDSI
jgi:hypothetical protein